MPSNRAKQVLPISWLRKVVVCSLPVPSIEVFNSVGPTVVKKKPLKTVEIIYIIIISIIIIYIEDMKI